MLSLLTLRIKLQARDSRTWNLDVEDRDGPVRRGEMLMAWWFRIRESSGPELMSPDDDQCLAVCHKLRSLGSGLKDLSRLNSRETGDRLFLILAVVLAIAAGVFFFLYSAVGTDDALIYFRVARNIRSGVGPVINAGDLHSPVTSILWAYLLAWASMLSGCSDFGFVAMAMDAALIALSSLMFIFSIPKQLGSVALLAPFGLISVRLFLVLPGLETCLAIFGLSLVCFCFFSLESLPFTGMAIGFGFFCRGDVVLLAIPIGLIVLFRLTEGGEAVTLAKIVRGAASLGVVLAVGLLLQRAATGHFLPVTMHAKILQGKVGPWSTFGQSGFKYAWEALDQQWLLALMAAIGIIASRMTGFTLLAVALIHWCAYSLLSVANYPWYSWLIMLSLRLAVAIGIGFVIRGSIIGLWVLLRSGHGREKSQRHLQLLSLTSVLVAFVVLFMVFSARPVKRFRELPYLAASAFNLIYYQIAESICGDRTDVPHVNGPFLGQEIGMVGFMCPDLEIRDVNGLATPGIDAETLNNWEHWVSVYKPAYLSLRGQHTKRWTFTVAGKKRIYSPLINLKKKRFQVSLLIRTEKGMTVHPIGVEKALYNNGFEDGSVKEWSFHSS